MSSDQLSCLAAGLIIKLTDATFCTTDVTFHPMVSSNKVRSWVGLSVSWRLKCDTRAATLSFADNILSAAIIDVGPCKYRLTRADVEHRSVVDVVRETHGGIPGVALEPPTDGEPDPAADIAAADHGVENDVHGAGGGSGVQVKAPGDEEYVGSWGPWRQKTYRFSTIQQTWQQPTSTPALWCLNPLPLFAHSCPPPAWAQLLQYTWYACQASCLRVPHSCCHRKPYLMASSRLPSAAASARLLLSPQHCLCLDSHAAVGRPSVWQCDGPPWLPPASHPFCPERRKPAPATTLSEVHHAKPQAVHLKAICFLSCRSGHQPTVYIAEAVNYMDTDTTAAITGGASTAILWVTASALSICVHLVSLSLVSCAPSARLSASCLPCHTPAAPQLGCAFAPKPCLIWRILRVCYHGSENQGTASVKAAGCLWACGCPAEGAGCLCEGCPAAEAGSSCTTCQL